MNKILTNSFATKYLVAKDLLSTKVLVTTYIWLLQSSFNNQKFGCYKFCDYKLNRILPKFIVTKYLVAKKKRKRIATKTLVAKKKKKSLVTKNLVANNNSLNDFVKETQKYKKEKV